MNEPRENTENAEKEPSPLIPLPSDGRGEASRRGNPLCVFCALLRPSVCLPLLLIVAFVMALGWAKARDPLRRVSFSLHTPDGVKTAAMAVLPKREGDFPVVLYAHGSGGTVTTTGDKLRIIAELGLAAVDFEYNQTNQAGFDAQMRALLEYLPRQSWARSNAVAWVANSLGAQRTLSFLLRHPEYQPQVLVRLSGGWVEELDSQSTVHSPQSTVWSQRAEVGRLTPESAIGNRQSAIDRSLVTSAATVQTGSQLRYRASRPSTNLNCLVWLVHGENDEIFPVADCRRLADVLKADGTPVRLTVFPGRAHSFGEDQLLLTRAAGEFCAEQFGGAQPVRVNVRPALWHYWLPVIGLALLAGWLKLRGYFTDALKHGSRLLLGIAVVTFTLAALDTALHLGLPRLRVSPVRIALARSWLVKPDHRADFDWLVKQAPAQGRQLKPLLEHLELAELQRRFFDPHISETTYREFVLCPWIEERADADIAWRRPLWEAFYPRIRHESDPESAAAIVARFLRERVLVRETGAGAREILEIWAGGETDAAGFERVYTAALRSVGMPARIGRDGRTELLAGGQWRPAPRPFLETVGHA